VNENYLSTVILTVVWFRCSVGPQIFSSCPL